MEWSRFGLNRQPFRPAVAAQWIAFLRKGPKVVRARNTWLQRRRGAQVAAGFEIAFNVDEQFASQSMCIRRDSGRHIGSSEQSPEPVEGVCPPALLDRGPDRRPPSLNQSEHHAHDRLPPCSGFASVHSMQVGGKIYRAGQLPQVENACQLQIEKAQKSAPFAHLAP